MCTFTIKLRDQLITVVDTNDDVSLLGEDHKDIEWRITDDEWFEILAEARSRGYETDFWAYDPPECDEPSTPKFPNVCVQLTGQEGNVFSILGRVQRGLKEGDVSDENISAFWDELSAVHSYDEALQIIMHWVRVS
ncbi:MAG: hypothetical protein JSR66_32770 [Proteobacteria bacterium]|nr:hypothetical protein [Pseudomonadota bacterium]